MSAPSDADHTDWIAAFDQAEQSGTATQPAEMSVPALLTDYCRGNAIMADILASVADEKMRNEVGKSWVAGMTEEGRACFMSAFRTSRELRAKEGTSEASRSITRHGDNPSHQAAVEAARATQARIAAGKQS